MKNNYLFKAILMVAALVFASLMATDYAWQLVKQDAENIANERFQSRVLQINAAVQERMRAYEQLLRGGVGLFYASGRVGRKDWHDYVSSLRRMNIIPVSRGWVFPN
jgi:hypothetical protein